MKEVKQRIKRNRNLQNKGKKNGKTFRIPLSVYTFDSTFLELVYSNSLYRKTNPVSFGFGGRLFSLLFTISFISHSFISNPHFSRTIFFSLVKLHLERVLTKVGATKL